MYMMYQTVYEKIKEERVSQLQGENDIRARCRCELWLLAVEL